MEKVRISSRRKREREREREGEKSVCGQRGIDMHVLGDRKLQKASPCFWRGEGKRSDGSVRDDGVQSVRRFSSSLCPCAFQHSKTKREATRIRASAGVLRARSSTTRRIGTGVQTRRRGREKDCGAAGRLVPVSASSRETDPSETRLDFSKLASSLYKLQEQEEKNDEKKRDFSNLENDAEEEREGDIDGGLSLFAKEEDDENAEKKRPKLPTVVVVGRPNVGKSALFNRLSGKQAALVADIPGVTRDRLYAEVTSEDIDFELVDTGGLFSESDFKGDLNPEVLRSKMTRQVGTALEESVALIFVVDGQDGVTQSDMEVSKTATHSHTYILYWYSKRGKREGGREGCTILLLAYEYGILTLRNDMSCLCLFIYLYLFIYFHQTGIPFGQIAKFLRQNHSEKEIVLAVNKCESTSIGDALSSDFWKLGFGEPHPVSAISATGIYELMTSVQEGLANSRGQRLGVPKTKDEEKDYIKVAFVGRPNVGKSSLVNNILRSDRMIVNDASGTTTNSVDSYITIGERDYCYIDTAGLRKLASVQGSQDVIERLSVKQSLRSIRESNVTVLLLDAAMGPTKQDFRIAEECQKHGCACVISVNKWDIFPDNTYEDMLEYKEYLLESMRNISWAKVVFTSALENSSRKKVVRAIESCLGEYTKRLPTALLNTVTQEAVAWNSPPSSGRKAGKIYYCTQASIRPPSFVFFVNHPELFDDQYTKYMENQLRKNAGFEGTPIRIYWRGKAE